MTNSLACWGSNHSDCPGYAWDLVTERHQTFNAVTGRMDTTATVTEALVTCGCPCGCFGRNWPEGGTNHHIDPNRVPDE